MRRAGEAPADGETIARVIFETGQRIHCARYLVETGREAKPEQWDDWQHGPDGAECRALAEAVLYHLGLVTRPASASEPTRDAAADGERG
jgi:hypothetical protein